MTKQEPAVGSVRILQQEDLEMVLAWRNHESVRQMMFSSEPISLEQHTNWFERATKEVDRQLLVFELDGQPAGFANLGRIASGGITDWGFYLAPNAPKGSGRQLGFTVSDITYICARSGWLYLAVVMDLFSRRIVGWTMATHMQTSLIRDALKMALQQRRSPRGLVLHSDRGSHEYQAMLKANGIVCSMRRQGDCWDNAAMEQFFLNLKMERVSQRRLCQSWRGRTWHRRTCCRLLQYLLTALKTELPAASELRTGGGGSKTTYCGVRKNLTATYDA